MKVKKTIKKTVAAFMCLIMVFTCFATSASAATNWPAISTSKYIKVYTISTGNNTTAYTSSSLSTKKGTIYASDEIYVYSINNQYVYCSYPTSKGRKYAYIPTSAITSNNWSHVTSTARAKITTYKRASTSSSYGSIYSGDQVIAIASNGNFVQVIYPAGNHYKMAWITKNNYNSYVAPKANYSTPLTSGTSYYITPKCAQNKVLDCNGAGKANGTNIQIWDKANVPNQKFKAVSAGNGYYYFVDNNSGRVLDINGGVAENFTNCQLWEYNGTNAQLFRLVSAGDGYYYMVSKINSNYQLDVNGAYSDNGTNVQLYWKNTSDAQKFKFTAVSNATNTSNNTMTNALYKINVSGSKITCGFDGYKNTKGRHEGIDFKNYNGASVYSLTSGVITRITYGSNGSSGLSTIAIYDSSSDKTVVYLHTAPVSGLKAGQNVSKGQKIATESWRGVSSANGGHTHVEVRNGRKTAAAKSVNDYNLENPNPTSFWQSKGYIVK